MDTFADARPPSFVRAISLHYLVDGKRLTFIG